MFLYKWIGLFVQYLNHLLHYLILLVVKSVNMSSSDRSLADTSYIIGCKIRQNKSHDSLDCFQNMLVIGTEFMIYDAGTK